MSTLDIYTAQINSLHMEPVYTDSKQTFGDEIKDKYHLTNCVAEEKKNILRNIKSEHLTIPKVIYDDESPYYLTKALHVFGRLLLESDVILKNVDMEKTDLVQENLPKVINSNNYYREQCRVIFTKLQTMAINTSKKVSGRLYDIYSMSFIHNGKIDEYHNIYMMK